MDDVFEALAHRVRREILDIVRARPGCGVQDVCDYFEISRIAVMKHLRILERAGLIHSEKRGRRREIYFNAVPIQMIYERWTSQYSAYWAGGLSQMKYRIETLNQPVRGRTAASGSEAASGKRAGSSKNKATRKKHA